MSKINKEKIIKNNEIVMLTSNKVIALQQGFISIIGLDAAVLLSQAIYWQNKMGKRSWYKTQQDWESEIGLSRRQQERARSILRAQNPCFWFEKYAGTPRRLFFKVDLTILATMAKKSSQVCSKVESLPAPSVHASKSECDKHYSKLQQKNKAGDFLNSTVGIGAFVSRHLKPKETDHD